MDPVTAAIASGLISGGGTFLQKGGGQVLGAIAGEKLDPTSAGYLAQQQQDVRKLRQGKLGWTAAQKRQSVGEARRQIDAASKGAEAELRREAAASGGFGRSGAQQGQQAAIYDSRALGIAEAQKGAEALSQQQAQAAAVQIRAAAAERARAMAERGALAGQAAGEGLVAGVKSGVMGAQGAAQGLTSPGLLQQSLGYVA